MHEKRGFPELFSLSASIHYGDMIALIHKILLLLSPEDYAAGRVVIAADIAIHLTLAASRAAVERRLKSKNRCGQAEGDPGEGLLHLHLLAPPVPQINPISFLSPPGQSTQHFSYCELSS